MNLPSLLFPTAKSRELWNNADRSFCADAVADLNIDAIIREIELRTEGFPGQYLKFPAQDAETAGYRLEMTDELIHSPGLREKFIHYCVMVVQTGKRFEAYNEAKHPIHRNLCFLAAVREYVRSINELAAITADAKSAGFRKLALESDREISSERFQRVRSETAELDRLFQKILCFRVDFDFNQQLLRFDFSDSGGDLSGEIVSLSEELFGITPSSCFSVISNAPITALEEELARQLESQYPEQFKRLRAFCKDYEAVNPFDLINLKKELTFYIGVTELMQKFAAAGFPVCMPSFNDTVFEACDFYDPGLAVRMLADGKHANEMVFNDIKLQKGSLFLLTGANQGGKTTCLRSVGLIALLAQNGCPVPCRKCRLPWYDGVFTHFNRPEVIGVGKGRLGEETERFKTLLPRIGPDSLLLINELFASTRRKEGVELAVIIIDRLLSAGCTAGFATHLYELADIYKQRDEQRIISLVAGVEAGENGGVRTYKISACPPDGLAYAHDIAVACGITYSQLEELQKGGAQ